MRKHRVYIQDELLPGQELELDRETSHYLTTVLRLKNGFNISVFNGDGNEYSALLQTQRKSASIQVNELLDANKSTLPHIHLIQSVARGDHMDYAVQKATELGVAEITPVISQRTQGHDNTRLEKRQAHWKSIIVNACEQSGRSTLPLLNDVCDYEAALKQANSDLKFICQPSEDTIRSINDAKSITVLIGPEGGFTDTEIVSALEKDFSEISLGENILRTETAASSVLSIINYLHLIR